jgi:hypothetical protein
MTGTTENSIVVIYEPFLCNLTSRCLICFKQITIFYFEKINILAIAKTGYTTILLLGSIVHYKKTFFVGTC